ncbi:hypothetical protein V8G54_033706, partial [Vigna mungo]
MESVGALPGDHHRRFRLVLGSRQPPIREVSFSFFFPFLFHFSEEKRFGGLRYEGYCSSSRKEAVDYDVRVLVRWRRSSCHQRLPLYYTKWEGKRRNPKRVW